MSTRKKQKKPKGSQASVPFLAEISPVSVLRPSISIDQSLSSTGIAVFMPVNNHEEVRSICVSAFLGLDTEERQKRLTAVDSIIEDYNFNKKPSNISVTHLARSQYWGSGPRKHKKMIFGAIIANQSGVYILVTGTIPEAASDLPEFISARRVASVAHEILSSLTNYASEKSIKEIAISLECLAMGGSALTTRILPVLGIVWAAMAETLHNIQTKAPPGMNIAMIGFQISSWKKEISGAGNTKKDGIEESYLRLLGAPSDRFSVACHDESDAGAMAMLAAHYAPSGVKTSGRIRPELAKKP